MKIRVLNKLHDTLAVIVNDSVYRKFKIALASSKDATLPICIMPASHPDINAQVNIDEYFVTPKTLKVFQANSEELNIKLVSNGLFVYGTLVKRGIYPNGQTFEGWGGLCKFPMIKAMIDDYALYYRNLPYAIRQDKQNILGETYLDVDDDAIKNIHEIEIGAGYHETAARATIMENFPLIGDVEVKFYEHKSQPSGIKMKTMIYGEAFYVNGKMIYFEHNKYFSALRGNCPIIITAPHGGYYRPIDMPMKGEREADEETYELAREIIVNIYEMSDKRFVPSAVLARIHRSRVDLNNEQDFYESSIAKIYHNTISELASERKVLLIDIHGMSEHNDYDVELGTMFGRTINGREDVVNSALDVLEKSNLSVCVDRKYFGGFTVRKHGRKNNVIAIQIEVNKRLRSFDKYKNTAKILADTIIQAYQLL